MTGRLLVMPVCPLMLHENRPLMWSAATVERRIVFCDVYIGLMDYFKVCLFHVRIDLAHSGLELDDTLPVVPLPGIPRCTQRIYFILLR